MRFSTPILLAAAAGSSTTLAAPVPSLFGDIIAALAGAADKVTETLTTDVDGASGLAAAVKKLGATLQSNAGIHGNKLGCNDLDIPKVHWGGLGKLKHIIKWPGQKKHKYLDWKTYKSNGVNLGAWMEIEQNYDLDWWSENVGSFPDEWASPILNDRRCATS